MPAHHLMGYWLETRTISSIWAAKEKKLVIEKKWETYETLTFEKEENREVRTTGNFWCE